MYQYKVFNPGILSLSLHMAESIPVSPAHP